MFSTPHATLSGVKRGNQWRATKYIASHEHAFVYFSTPKVACSSIKTALLPFFGIEDRRAHPADVVNGIHAVFDHSGHQIDKAQLLEYLQSRYSRYFKFAFVRNPWDRLLSCYSQKLAPGGQGLGREEWAGERLWVGMSFPDFARAVCRISDEESNPHFRSQHVTVCSNGRQRRILADFVGQFERLEEDFARVTRDIGIDAELPHLLHSERDRSYHDQYDRSLAAMVGERYRLDAEIFGYAF